MDYKKAVVESVERMLADAVLDKIKLEDVNITFDLETIPSQCHTGKIYVSLTFYDPKQDHVRDVV